MYIHTIRSNCACIYVCICVRMYMYVLMYMDVCCMHSARTGYIYECVCTGYIYECIPHAHAHACIHARIHSYLGRLGSALSSERPPVLVLLRCFSSHPVLNRHLSRCFYVYVCVECNRDHHSEFVRAGMHAPPASCQHELTLGTKSRQREEASEGLKHGSQTNIPNFG